MPIIANQIVYYSRLAEILPAKKGQMQFQYSGNVKNSPLNRQQRCSLHNASTPSQTLASSLA